MLTELLDQISPEKHPLIWLLLACGLGYVFCVVCLPSILFVSRERKLMAEPENRSSHQNSTPTLGGVAIFISIMLVITFIGAFLDTRTLLLVMGALTILFFLGLKDDLANISPLAKVIGQLAAILVLVVFTDTRIISFSGICGLDILPYGVSVGLTVFVFLLLINAINLIDGIDGLAGCVVSVSCFALGIFFYEDTQISLATLAAALIGTLIAFLRYNFSEEKKIFMGDTGSLVIGYLLAFLTVSFINSEQSSMSMNYHDSAGVLAFAVVFYPLADTARIFFLRIFKYRRNPFVADRNHIHHQYTNLGYSHKRSTFQIVVTNIIIILIAFILRDFDTNIQLVALLFYGPLLYSTTFIYKRVKKYQSKKRDERQVEVDVNA